MSLDSSARNKRAAAPAADTAAIQKELSDLRKQVTLLERQREDDKARLRELTKAKEDGEQFAAQKPKLTERIASLEAEVREYGKMEREWISQKDALERQMQDIEEQLEIATLDKEMAEEKAEAAAAELLLEKDRSEELQIDLEVLKEQQAAAEARLDEVAADDSPEAEQAPSSEKHKARIILLERQNERYKEALIR